MRNTLFRIVAGMSAFCICLVGLLLTSAPAQARDLTLTLGPDVVLGPNEALLSPNGLYRLIMQGDGNAVVYSMPNYKPLWATNTGTPNSVLRMQGDGNLVVRAPGNVPVWSSGTGGRPNTVLEMQNDANLVLYAPGHVAIWQTGVNRNPGCGDNDLGLAETWAGRGEWFNPVRKESYRDQNGRLETVGTIELRFNAPARCAWALGSGGAGTQVWIDRSANGGASWDGPLGRRSVQFGNSTTYTGVFNDTVPYVVRACVQSTIGGAHCTQWY
ncbi:hypothetical protein ABZS77_01455 [Micromonospora sp. NPDC005298]|uniref:hypothetical protein n=1 Tax=Micromonospora sp. NPDC005298 TaxID=3156873 RepID=UPI0033BEBD06